MVDNFNPNPYAAPAAPGQAVGMVDLDAPTLMKVEAVIKDAGQFWLAILLCFLCSGLGMIVIGPWYLVRLLQWNSLAQNHAWLCERDAQPGSLPKRFQSAKWKLIVGLVVGLVLMIMLVGLVLSRFLLGVSA